LVQISELSVLEFEHLLLQCRELKLLDPLFQNYLRLEAVAFIVMLSKKKPKKHLIDGIILAKKSASPKPIVA